MEWYACGLMLFVFACWLAQPADGSGSRTLEWRLLSVPFAAAALLAWIGRFGQDGATTWIRAVAAVALSRCLVDAAGAAARSSRLHLPATLAALTIGALCGVAAAADDLDTIAVIPLHAAQAAATTLEPIVVTGTRTEHRLSDAPVDVQLITAADIRNSGARDLAELLEREGGVYVTRVAGRGTRIEIQGLSSEHVLILIDGRRMIGRINGAIDLTRLRVADIERIEIVKGPSSALYGADALGGVVNVVTRKSGTQAGAALSVRGDADGNAETYGHAGWSLGRLSGLGSAGLQHNEAFDLDESTQAGDGADADGGYATADLSWRWSDTAELGMSGAYALDDRRRLDPGSGSSTADTRKRTEEVRVGLAPALDVAGSTHLTLDAYYHRYFDQLLQRNARSGAVALDEETVADLFVASGQIDHHVGRHLLSLGAEAQLERLDADRLQAAAERDRQSVFLQDQVDLLGGRLQLVPGLRYERDSQFDEQLSPKLALRYDLRDDLVLRAGYGRGYRAPDFKQLLMRFENSGVGYRVDGNPELKPERSTGFNVGATWFASPGTSVALTAYHNRVRDVIEIVQIDDGPPIVFSYRNVASARLTGVDLQTQLRPWQPLEVRLGYGWLDAEDADSGAPLSGRAAHRGNFALRFEQPHYALQWRGVWIGSRSFDTELDTGGAPAGAGEADAYALYDLRGEWTRGQRWLLAAGVDNVFDAGDAKYLPIQPRSVYLEVRRSFR